MAGALTRLMKRFAKNDSNKDSQKDRTAAAQAQVYETRVRLDAVSYEKDRLQAEKEQLEMNVHMLQQKLQEFSLSNGSVNAIGIGNGMNRSFVNSDDGQPRVSVSIASVTSGLCQETPHSIPDSSSTLGGFGMDLWSSAQAPPNSCLPALMTNAHSISSSQSTARPPLSSHSYRSAQQQSLLTGVHGSGPPTLRNVHMGPSPGQPEAGMGQAMLELLSQLQETGSVLGIACKKGWFEVVQALLESGADVNEIDQEVGLAPLHIAIAHHHKDVVALLLQHGAFPNLVATNGQTPLQVAVAHNQCSIAALLVHNGAELDARGMTSASVLHEAAKDGHVEMLRTLLMTGADLESRDQQGRTALHSAIMAGKAAVVEVLVGVGANIHTKSLRGLSMWDALRVAISEGRCTPEASARIQSILWASDGVKSRRGSRASEDASNSRAFRMSGDSP